MRNIPQCGIDLIKKFEGCSLDVYNDVAGLKTIGYGHLLLPGEKYSTITMDKADQLLRQDLQMTINAIFKLTTVELSNNQLGALLSFVFNLGSGCYQRSTLRQVINRREYIMVPSQFMRYIYAGGRPIKGLMNRRGAECMLWNAKPQLGKVFR